MTIITVLTQREQQTVREGLFNKDSTITLKTLKPTILYLSNLEILTDAFRFSFSLSPGKTGNSRNKILLSHLMKECPKVLSFPYAFAGNIKEFTSSRKLESRLAKRNLGLK